MWENILSVLTSMPVVKRRFWRMWYQQISKRCPFDEVLFLNYGYAYLNENEHTPKLDASDEVNRHTIQLYHHLADRLDLKGKSVLEIGSGRGGGASYVARYLSPQSVIGIDLSSSAVDFCNNSHKVQSLSFKVGDSENLPFDNNTFDVVMNIESSHCYPNVPRFLKEVRRVLKPGGHFLFCDVRQLKKLEELEKQLANCGLTMESSRDITSNVVTALDEIASERQTFIDKSVPQFFSKAFASFAGIPGGSIYESFLSGKRRYISCMMKKPA